MMCVYIYIYIRILKQPGRPQRVAHGAQRPRAGDMNIIIINIHLILVIYDYGSSVIISRMTSIRISRSSSYYYY